MTNLPIKFTKMHGLGNDFVIVDGIRQQLSAGFTQADKITALASRRYGIGCDQLLLVEPTNEPTADFSYRIFNADGGEVGQCGNGARCVHAFLHRQGITDKTDITLQTVTTRIRTTRVGDNAVRAHMQAPVFGEIMEVEGYVFQALDLGNPQAVCLTGCVADDVLCRLAQRLNDRMPDGVNVGVGEVSPAGIILRVVERGSGLTDACGSGALAAGCVAIRDGRANNPVQVTMSGGALLCGISAAGQAWLEGDVTHVFDGVLSV